MDRISIFVTRYILCFLTLVFAVCKANAEETLGTDTLSDQSYISLLIASPGEENSWTVFGHAGIRVYDPTRGIDLTFNYGIFSFTDDFIFRFVKGETDYMVAPSYTNEYMDEYLNKGRDVTEFILELRNNEKNYIWNYLLWNIRPENAVYRYNFLYNNCSTKPLDIILNATGGKFIFPDVKQDKSWRAIINKAERNKPWVMFGSNLALGEPNDKIPSIKETLFLPSYVCKYLPATKIERKDGTILAVVNNEIKHKSHVLADKKDSVLIHLITPLNVSILFLMTSVLLLRRSIRSKHRYRIFESLVFLLSSSSGFILMMLSFFSEHPHTFPNYNIVIFNPLFILVLPLTWTPRLKKLYICFHITIFVTIILFFITMPFIKQTFEPGIIIFALCILVESLRGILCVLPNANKDSK